MKKLPIGIQTFSEIRKENYIYIDKTKEAYELIDNYKYSFLSRPRRFGKSLFLDTLHNIFEGNKELFEGLYIYDKWNWDDKYPVIKFSFKTITKTDELLEDIYRNLTKNQERLGVTCSENLDYANCFEELIQKTYKKYNKRVVILIDEYDKPILDLIENIEVAKEHREIIKRLYSTIKDNDAYLKFAFLTGVSKFSKASIFSGLNNITDISLNKKYGNICGYTHENLQNEFKEYLEDVDLDKVREWYNGYYFLKDRIYNPFDILQFIGNDKEFRNYWFESGTPTYLLKLIQKNNYFLPRLSNITVGEEIVSSFDIENINLEVILYQSGYLTIDERIIDEDDEIEYKLKLPNKEVKISLNRYIIDYFFRTESTRAKLIRKALKTANLEEFKNILISIFASIPYNNYTNNNIQIYEGFYASVIYTYLQALGIEIIGEDVTNQGRIDLTCFIEDKIYIIEFKTTDEDPLAQIHKNKYYQKYINNSQFSTPNSQIFLVGINFDKEEKNIKNFAWEKI
jgi:hypothetical protein